MDNYIIKRMSQNLKMITNFVNYFQYLKKTVIFNTVSLTVIVIVDVTSRSIDDIQNFAGYVLPPSGS